MNKHKMKTPYVPSKGDKITIVLGIVLLPFFVYMNIDFIKTRKQYNRLKIEGIVDTAMITQPSIRVAKGSNICRYVFRVGGKTYVGSTSLGAKNKVCAGELYLVRYLPEDTTINSLVEDEDYRFLRVTSPGWVKPPEIEKVRK